MPIRMTGMNSGLDTDAIIQELVKASSEKKTKLEKAQTKLSWKQDTWKTLNTKIYSFFQKTLSDLKYASAYKKKSTTVSNESIASVVTGDGAVNGTQTLSVSALAKAGYLTGGKLITESGKLATGKTKLSELGADGTTADGMAWSVTVGGKTTTLSLGADATIDDVVKELNAAGVTANFDSANQRIFVNTAKSGKANDFSITANNAAGLSSLVNLGLFTAAETGQGSQAAKWSAYRGATDAETLQNLMDAGELTAREKEKAAAYLADSKNRIKQNGEIKKSLDKIEAAYQDDGTNNMKTQTEGIFADSKNQEIFAAAGLTDFGSFDTAADLDTEKLQAAQDALQAKWDELESMPTDAMTEEEKTARTEEMMRLSTEIAKTGSAVSLSRDYQAGEDTIAANNAALAENATYIEEVELDADGNYKIATVTDADGNETEATTATATAKLTEETGRELVEKVNTAAAMSTVDVEGTASKTAVRIAGADAEIKLNGADYTSSTNSFSVNGLTITAKDLTTSDISIVTADDVGGVYDVVKKFIKGYNELINEMDSLYNSASSKGYEPLSAEEKESMPDDEIAKWEDKIRDSLLRRDSTLGTVINTLKDSMMKSFTVGGKSMTLSSFGISTLGYFGAAENERGAYHIDGDPDDESTAAAADKLKTMIANDPSVVSDFFTQLTGGLYGELDKQMKSTDYRSVYHVYDDKKMQKDYDDYTKKIKAQETKLTELEDRYYKQFSVMETALAKMQGNQSAVSALLGGG